MKREKWPENHNSRHSEMHTTQPRGLRRHIRVNEKLRQVAQDAWNCNRTSAISHWRFQAISYTSDYKNRKRDVKTLRVCRGSHMRSII